MVLYRKMMGEESILVVKKCLIALPEDGFLIRKIRKNIIVDEEEICYYNCSGDITYLHFYEKTQNDLPNSLFSNCQIIICKNRVKKGGNKPFFKGYRGND